MQTLNTALCSGMTTGQTSHPPAGGNYRSWQIRSTLNLDSIVFGVSLSGHEIVKGEAAERQRMYPVS